MFWPDNGTGVDVQPSRKTVNSTVRKFFTEGGGGKYPTIPGGDWFNQITNELLNVLSFVGIDPSKADDDQLLQAINSLISSSHQNILELINSRSGASEVGSSGGDSVQQVIDDIHGGVDVRSIVTDLTSDNRGVIFSYPGKVHVPVDITVRCNLLPSDDVRKFVGHGSVITTDPWGFTHTLDVAAVNSGPKLTTRQMLSRANVALSSMSSVRVGCLGDSITDGAWGGEFESPNPTDVDGNLSSTDYIHGATEATGGKAWFTRCINNLIGLIGHNADHPRFMFTPFNAASSGKGIANGWAYRNFDYGFFQNQAYGNDSPDVLFVSMGTNDVLMARTPELQDDYIDKCSALIAKAAGYGCKSVCFIAITHWRPLAVAFYEATFKHISARHPTVDFVNVAKHLEDYSNSGKGSYTGAWLKLPSTGGGFDSVHPSVDGHKLIAGAVSYELMPDRVTRVCHGDRFVAAQPGATQAYTQPFDEIIPFGIPVNEAWLLPETGWPIYQASSSSSGLDLTLRHFVWCDEPMNVMIIEPKQADWPSGSTKTTSVSVMRHGYDESSLVTEPLSSSGRSFPSFCATVVKDLVQGLNIIDIKYDNVLNMYAPLLQFYRSGYYSKSLGPIAINIPSNTAMLYRHSTELETVNQHPERMPSRGSDWLATFRCGNFQNGLALLGWFDVHAGVAYGVLKVSATQVQVCSVTSGVTMSPIQTIDGDFSSDITIQFAQIASGGLIQVTDSALLATSVSLTDTHGGAFGLANTNLSPARVAITDARIDIPRGNGTLII